MECVYLIVSGSFDILEMDSLASADVKTRHGSVTEVNLDGAEAEGRGGEGASLQDIPDHQCSLCGRRLHGQVSAIL